MYRRIVAGIFALCIVLLQGCGGSNPGPSSSGGGMVSVSITDAPAYGYDHVWITVRALWFHEDGEAEPEQPGWYRFPLASPVTLDLLDLSNGNISAPLWDGIELPAGTYRQVRIYLAATEDTLAASAVDAGLAFNNQVDVTGDTAAYPLRVPDARRGIILDDTFEVKKGDKLRIAIDFDAGHDVVKVEHDGGTEYILKPRPVHFDLDNAGAIIGHIDTLAASNCAAARFVVKAEQPGPDGAVHVVRRATFIADKDTGRFVLYPLLPGNYDVLIRGLGYETVIIRNVPVVRGTKPTADATEVPAVAMTPSPSDDYPASASIISPTGAWVSYYQTVPGEDAPYLVRFRHFDPLTGRFDAFPLSTGPLQVGTYDRTTITLGEVVPVEGTGGFRAEAGAILHERSGFVSVTEAGPVTVFGTLDVRYPAAARRVSGMLTAPVTGPDRGVLFAVHGGMIVHAVNVDDLMVSGGSYTLENLPGGTPARPLPLAFYGVEAVGWSSSEPALRAVSLPRFVDLQTADAADIDLSMIMLP
jgi:hypothetical protein